MQIILINKNIAYVKKWNRAELLEIHYQRKNKNIVIRARRVDVTEEKSGESVEVSRVNEAERSRKIKTERITFHLEFGVYWWLFWKQIEWNGAVESGWVEAERQNGMWKIRDGRLGSFFKSSWLKAG